MWADEADEGGGEAGQLARLEAAEEGREEEREEVTKMREWEERMERRRVEWKKQMEKVHDPPSAAMADHFGGADHPDGLSQAVQNLHHVNEIVHAGDGMVDREDRVDAGDHEDQFIVDC